MRLGKPKYHLVMPAPPDAAVVARSALAVADSVVVAGRGFRASLRGGHVVTNQGRMVLVLSAGPVPCARVWGSPDGSEVTAVHVTDVAPLAVRERVRARVTVMGRSTRPEPAALDDVEIWEVANVLHATAALRVFLPEAVVVDHQGATTFLTADSWRDARPDVVCTHEAPLLTHLVESHADVLAGLIGLLDRDVVAAADRVVPLALDSRGIVLRAEFPTSHVDLPLWFDRPLQAPSDMRREMRSLISAAVADG
jgi:hypothetical protein